MVEGEPGRVEKLPLEAEVARDAVQRITGHGKVDCGQMHTDLVRTARFEPHAHERVLRQELLELEMRHGSAWCVGVERMPEPVVPVAPDRRVDRPAARPWPPHDEPEVFASQRAFSDEPLQPLVRLVRTRDDEQAGRISVEAVDDARPFLLPTHGPCGRESVSECAGGVPRSGMDDDTRGFVHDEQVFVRVRDCELRRRDARGRGLRLGLFDRNLLPTRELVAFPARLPVHEDRAGLEQTLGRSPRTHLGQPREVAIEPLTCGVGRDDEPVQRFGE